MNRSHGFWSFGFFGAGVVGALSARWGVSPQTQLMVTVLVVVVVGAVLAVKLSRL